MPLNPHAPIPSVNILWSRYDTTANWFTEPTRGTLTLNNPPPAVGKGSIQVEGKGELWFFSRSPMLVDCTHVTHLDFWFYTDTPTIFQQATDCGLELSYTQAWSEGGVRVTANTLRELSLQTGWNHLTLPLDFSAKTNNCDLTKIGRFRFYAVGLKETAFQVRLSQVRFVNQGGLTHADQVIAHNVTTLITAIGTPNTYSEPAILRAKDHYNQLTQTQKELVENGQALRKAETLFAQLQTQGKVVFPQEIENKPAPFSSQVSFPLAFCHPHDLLEIHGANTLHYATCGAESFPVWLTNGEDQPLQLMSADFLQEQPVPLQDFGITLQLYLSECCALNSQGRLELNFSNGDTYHWTVRQMDLQNGWNTLYLPFSHGVLTRNSTEPHHTLRFCATLSHSILMAISGIGIIKPMALQLNESFLQENALAKWTAQNATLSWEKGRLQIAAHPKANFLSLSTSAYALPILNPARTPLEFDLYQPQGELEGLQVELTDLQGKKVAKALDLSSLAHNRQAHFRVIPSQMEGHKDFAFDRTQTLTFHIKPKTPGSTLSLSNLTATLREGEHWEDWVYHYQAKSGEYAFAVIPDLQELTAVTPQKLTALFQWITANQEAEAIKFAIQVGDLTWNGHAGNTEEFSTAATAFQQLTNSGVPYTLTYGNHDRQEGRDTTLLNRAFPYTAMENRSTFGGAMEEGKIDNLYHLLEVQGNRYLFLSLEWQPTPKAIAWANQIIAQHPHRQVIVVTHEYLSGVYGKRSPVGEQLWESLVAKHSNIVMVLCGHASLPTDPGSLNYKASQGEKGNTVHQIMVNAQDIDATRGGVGLLLLLRFRNGGKTVDLNYFSPLHNNLAYKEQNQFSITLDV